jgi:hypothetical protein
MGLRIAARDGNGMFLAAYSKQQSIGVSPLIAESLATLHEVIFCKEQGFIRATF